MSQGVRSTIQLNDQMTAPIKNITAAMNLMLSTLTTTQNAVSHGFEPGAVDAIREKIHAASAAIDGMEQPIRDNTREQERFNRSIRGGGSAADSLLGKLKGAVAAYAGLHAAGKVLNLSDQMTNTTARLNLIVDDGGSVEELQQKIRASAQSSRASYFDTANAIAKMGANAGAAFADNDELIAFMEQINKQFAIDGASAEEQKNAMLQLTQAMGAGALRGEELNSILENAPGIARAIEQYMGVAEGSIKQYAEQGLITSEVVKNAMFYVADETNRKFESMPVTWAQTFQQLKDTALFAFQPILQKINQIANSEKFQQFINSVVNAIQTIASVAGAVFDLVMGVAGAFAEWGLVEPILTAIVAGLIAWKIAMLAKAAADGIATIAQNGLNISMLACPATWIALALAALVGVIVWLANVLGGFDVLWKFIWASMQVAFYTVMAVILSGFWWMVYGFQWGWDVLCTGFEEVKKAFVRIGNGIADFFGGLWAGILLGIQGFVNGAIDIINGFTAGINWVTGIFGIPEIQQIQHVTFGTDAANKASANQLKRAAEYSALEAQVEAERANRQTDMLATKAKAENAWNDNLKNAGNA